VTVVCHSLSCLLWLHVAAQGSVNASRVVLVSPPASAVLPDTAASFRLDGLAASAVRASASDELLLVSSDADPYNPSGAQRLYGDPLGLRVQVVPGAGHFTPGDGFGRWPWALEWCLAKESA
jgi:predicted alpha/beta hydrolase family esterase